VGDLRIAKALKEAQGENLRGPRLKSSHRATQGLPQTERVSPRRRGRHERLIRNWNRPVSLTRSDHVQCRVDCGSAQIAFGVLERSRASASAKQTQKNCLQHIFRVPRIARDPIGRAEHEVMVASKRELEFVRSRDGRFP
jgi:hypothetical protein